MKRRQFLAAGGGTMMTLGASGMIPSMALAQDAPEVTEMVLGDPNAPVEVVEYASFTCPHCASFHANQFKALKENYIDTGRIRFVYREVYFDRPGLWASMIARCAGTDEFFFAFTDLLYTQQQMWLATGDPAGIIADLRRLAKTAGMEDATLDACLSDAPKAEALFNWYQENAERDGIRSTPSFLIDGENYSNMAYDEFAGILDGLLG
ncbi:MAG: DsbA family protein [Pseudomonadota bacterium]